MVTVAGVKDRTDRSKRLLLLKCASETVMLAT